ncbi:MAG: hypothetical protein H6686_08730 [Fibrobacteria bacterium]|nr:hypothetical protein [Fibrobacteria bacterium]
MADPADPRIEAWASHPSRSPQLALLAATLGQDLTPPALARLLRDLHAVLGPDLIQPWRRPMDDVRRACALPWLAAWPHAPLLAGWVVACGDFLRAHPDPSAWSENWPRPTDFVREIAQRIPWMGRRSPERVKAWRLARWLVRGEGLEAPLWPGSSLQSLRIPHPVVATPLGWLGLLPAGWEGRTSRERQEWTDSLASSLRPHDPASLWVPLETILRRGRLDHACAERIGGCERCPLRSPCKGDSAQRT